MIGSPQRVLTATTLKNGLNTLSRVKAQAVLFGLETSLASEEVVHLTWQSLPALRRNMTELASRIIALQPQHLRSNYVFWQQVGREPQPVYGLDHDVFEAFGLLWSELVREYPNTVLVDADADMNVLRQLGVL